MILVNSYDRYPKITKLILIFIEMCKVEEDKTGETTSLERFNVDIEN